MEKVELSILFSDIKDYTTISRRVPTAVLQHLIAEYLREMSKIVERFQGAIEKVMGDGIMAVFGKKPSFEDHAQRAVMAAIEMQQTVENLRSNWRSLGVLADLKVRIAIASGKVIAGDIDLKHRTEYALVGDPINLAARLQAKAPPGGILISQATHQRVADRIECRPRPNLEIKGYDDAVTAYQVLSGSLLRNLSSMAQKAAAEELDSGKPEKRRFDRKRLSTIIHYTHLGQRYTRKCLDISEAGMCLVTGHPMAEGDRIDIISSLPSVQGLLPVTIEGRVAWCRNGGAGTKAGIEFLAVRTQDPDTLGYLVKEIYGLEPAAASEPRQQKPPPPDVLHADHPGQVITMNGERLNLSYEDLNLATPDYLSRRLNHEFDRCRRYSHEFSCVAVRLHQLERLGDKAKVAEVLKKVAVVLLQAVRTTDEVFYLNEATFVVIAPETLANRASTLTRRIIGKIHRLLTQEAEWGPKGMIRAGTFTFDGRNAAFPAEVLAKTLSNIN